MQILSWNVNGLRAINKKGFLACLKKCRADIVCLQEIKASADQIPQKLLNPLGYHTYINAAERKGYAGVLVYTKEKPQAVNYILSEKDFDQEGRLIEIKFSRFTLLNVYMPHGGRRQERFKKKFAAYDALVKHLATLKKEKVLIVGDFNVAHQEIDLARPKENQKNTGFTPQERKQIDHILKAGYIDTFRKFNQEGGRYTWWLASHNARARNIGWRIDYAFASPPLGKKVQDAFIFPQIMGSDHCPIGVILKGV